VPNSVPRTSRSGLAHPPDEITRHLVGAQASLSHIVVFAHPAPGWNIERRGRIIRLNLDDAAYGDVRYLPGEVDDRQRTSQSRAVNNQIRQAGSLVGHWLLPYRRHVRFDLRGRVLAVRPREATEQGATVEYVLLRANGFDDVRGQ
jgi:hypothetical protein